MSDRASGWNETRNDASGVDRPGRRRWQIGLRTLILLMAAVAVWLTYFVNRRHNASLERRISAISPLAHELIIDDPKKVAFVKLEEHWFDENRWEIYLPEGAFRLCLATRGIDIDGLAPVVISAPIASGTHHLVLEQERDQDLWRIKALWDESELITHEEPKNWGGSGSTSTARSGQSAQSSPDQPILFLRRRFMRSDGSGRSTTRTGPTEGVLFWIERTAGPTAQP